MVQNQSQRVQINLDLSPELSTTIDHLKQQMDVDTAQVFLKAIALLEVALAAKQKGKNVWITDNQQNLETEIIGILVISH